MLSRLVRERHHSLLFATLIQPANSPNPLVVESDSVVKMHTSRDSGKQGNEGSIGCIRITLRCDFSQRYDLTLAKLPARGRQLLP
jgi:hypothetical protein